MINNDENEAYVNNLLWALSI